jgi:allene oxide cyclase
MRKSLIVTGLALTGVIVAAGVATAQARETHPARSHGHSFTVVEHAVTDTTTDTGAPGDSVGDVLTFANPVFNAANTKQVGTDNGSCLRTVAGAAYECSWTTTLAGGSLVVEGPFYDTHDSTLAIIGGTGKWATARGEMRLHARDAQGSAYDFVFHVMR